MGGVRPVGDVKKEVPVRFPEITPLTQNAPDLGRIEFLSQQAAAPGIRNLRSALSSALSVRSSNPNVAALREGAALQGFGSGLSEVLGAASRTGQQLYQPEFAAQERTREVNFRSTLERLMANYNADLEQYRFDRDEDSSGSSSGAIPMTQVGGTQAYVDARRRLDAFSNEQTSEFRDRFGNGSGAGFARGGNTRDKRRSNELGDLRDKIASSGSAMSIIGSK